MCTLFISSTFNNSRREEDPAELDMEFDAYSCYQQNAQKLKIRESTTYGLHIDEESSVIVSCTDFGHIHLYHHDMSIPVDNDIPVRNNDINSRKTLLCETPPIFSTQLSTFSQGKILFCGGRNNSLQGYLWNNLISAVHNTVISADFEFDCGSSDGAITSIACSPKHNLVYASNDRGVIFCHNIFSGARVKWSGGAEHSTYVHTLRIIERSGLLVSCDSSGLLCTWDVSTPGKLLGRSHLAAGVSESLGAQSSSSVWVSSLDVDVEGNFAYIGGGLESSGKLSSNTFHRPSSGWLASVLLGGTCEDGISAEEEDASTMVKCVSTPVPIQQLHLYGRDLMTAGAQPVLSCWRCHSLEHVSSMQTSSQSIFAIASYKPRGDQDKDTKLLAVGGSVPVLDLISVIGHKEAVLCPL